MKLFTILHAIKASYCPVATCEESKVEEICF